MLNAEQSKNVLPVAGAWGIAAKRPGAWGPCSTPWRTANKDNEGNQGMSQSIHSPKFQLSRWGKHYRYRLQRANKTGVEVGHLAIWVGSSWPFYYNYTFLSTLLHFLITMFFISLTSRNLLSSVLIECNHWTSAVLWGRRVPRITKLWVKKFLFV